MLRVRGRGNATSDGELSSDRLLSCMEDRMSLATITVSLAAAVSAVCAAALAQGAAGGPPKPHDGELAFNNACRTCHTLREGDNRLGPSLYSIVGRKAGALSGYGYSSAMQNAGLVWDKANLNRFIADPDQVVPGHNMKPYGGVASAEERARIIAYLE